MGDQRRQVKSGQSKDSQAKLGPYSWNLLKRSRIECQHLQLKKMNKKNTKKKYNKKKKDDEDKDQQDQ